MEGSTLTYFLNALNHNSIMTVTGQGATTLDHYPSGRIKAITHAKAGNTLVAYAYRYDLNGNHTERKEKKRSESFASSCRTYRGFSWRTILHRCPVGAVLHVVEAAGGVTKVCP